MTSQGEQHALADVSFITDLREKIQQIKEIMIAVATGGPRIQDKEADYMDLYLDIDGKIRYLQSNGIDIANPNQFRSLWDWYGYWSSTLPRYQNRRDYVQQLYNDVVIPIETVLDQRKSNPGLSTDLSQSLKLGVYRQTIESSERIPTEIKDSFRRFQADHPDSLKSAFIMMKFGNSKVHEDITDAIRSTLLPYGIQGLRADDKQYSDDLFPNVMTYMHGCGFGIAVFERIDADEFNPNVSLEVGYMLALRKSVCLLSDKTLKKMQTDLVGKLYSPFDTYDILNTINAQLSKWLLAKSIAS
jgi:hypothetical protein